ncbi:PAAR domain-containing protein [Stenotrophomonas sp. Marseille-Q5258]|uniref:PAAR domain-containing protein n=1 Tax=Stenotrophomonas sp. Marseille-Q5258 TaxID=2972779 RepID=UPI0021C624A6|nr:PAAR domain-containing protein [Stenotrophomonas sp. Marseille-Q5258]
MARTLVVVGDHLHLGGTVLAGSPFTDIDGRAVARVNDAVLCSKHGPGVIASGDATLIIDGNPVARHGDKASCGCTLLAGQQATVSVEAGGGGGGGGGSGGSGNAAAVLAAAVSIAAAVLKASKPADAPPAAPEEAPQCWVSDHEAKIAVNADGRYSETFDPAGTRYDWTFPVTYSIAVPLRSGGDVVVSIKVRVQPLAGVTAGDVTTAKLRMMEGVDTYWNGKFTLAVNDPQCGTRTFPIRYAIQWVDGGQDYTLQLHKEYDREMVDPPLVYVATTTDPWTYAHEFAHTLGLPDEYSENEDDASDTVRYIRPDGTVDPVGVEAMAYRDSTDPQATIMSTYHSAGTHPRHAWNIGREVQELLRRELGRELTCTVS